MQSTRKEVKNMQYQKPEIVPLGSAEELILGDKQLNCETFPVCSMRSFADSELDD
jgi:hypothetical protein